ncbi:MAG: hypothetical protein IT163_09670 [Bryobacterales bacterium]|nr:hypothetical protein [Bryobacterales bacterium]
MKPLILRATIALGATLPAGLLLFAQLQPQEDPPPKIKRSQIEAILKDDHEKSLHDAAELMRLSEELKMELEKGSAHTVSLASIRKTEEIEKLAKRIRGRLKRY